MDFEALSRFHLSQGSHDDPADGLCLMEAVSWLEGLPHSDHPACVCAIVGMWARRLNDWASIRDRQTLIPLIPQLVGTVSAEHRADRAKLVYEEVAYLGQTYPGEVALDLECAASLFESQYYGAAVEYLCGGMSYYSARCPDFFHRGRRLLEAMIDAGPNGMATGDPEMRVREYEALIA